MPRQWSQLSVGTDKSEPRGSFAKLGLSIRRESTESMVSMASEPASYSNNLYVASGIWLAEKKLDTVETNIVARSSGSDPQSAGKKFGEDERGDKTTFADAFGPEVEQQNFSSRLVGMLWSNPVAGHSAPQQRQKARPTSSGLGRRNVRERGSLGGRNRQSAHNMTSLDSISASVLGTPDADIAGSTVFDYVVPKRHMSHRVRAAARKVDPGRWLRRRMHRNADRRNKF